MSTIGYLYLAGQFSPNESEIGARWFLLGLAAPAKNWWMSLLQLFPKAVALLAQMPFWNINPDASVVVSQTARPEPILFRYFPL